MPWHPFETAEMPYGQGLGSVLPCPALLFPALPCPGMSSVALPEFSLFGINDVLL